MMRVIKLGLSEVYKIIFKLFGSILSKDNRMVIFESFMGKQFSDNPRAIYEYLEENYPEYKLIWSIDKNKQDEFSSRDILVIKRFSLKWLYYMNKSKFWVVNSRLPIWIPKPRKTIYLQTWHGTPLKRLAADMDEVHMPGTTTEKYKENFLKEASKWDYLISPNFYSTKIFKRAFGFNKTMLEYGYPRNDYLINNSSNEKVINNIKNYNNLPLNKKIILYAPTWRDNQYHTKGKYKFDLEIDFDMLQQELGNEYIILLRLHYLVADNLDLSKYRGFIYDFSKYQDIRELYVISDLLITDYSSVFFDYANLNRPMLFYVYDIEDYRDKLRGFYFDFESEAPGPLVKTTEGLIKEIKKIETIGFGPPKKNLVFINKFCSLEDGNATERVVKKVFISQKF
jgi:CDP-glycerol glycerophosphotransferase